LPKSTRQFVADKPRDNVAGAAGREIHDEMDRPAGIGVRKCRRRGGRGNERDRGGDADTECIHLSDPPRRSFASGHCFWHKARLQWKLHVRVITLQR